MKTRKKANKIKNLFSICINRKVLHFCYNWGAALVIIGAMFKILHFPYANQILVISMITEAIIFFISAFEISENEWKQKTPSNSDSDNDLFSENYVQQLKKLDNDVIEEKKKMTKHLNELNQLYSRMLHAMKNTDSIS